MWVMCTVYNILHILLGPYERGTTKRPYRIWFGLVWGGGGVADSTSCMGKKPHVVKVFHKLLGGKIC